MLADAFEGHLHNIYGDAGKLYTTGALAESFEDRESLLKASERVVALFEGC